MSTPVAGLHISQSPLNYCTLINTLTTYMLNIIRLWSTIPCIEDVSNGLSSIVEIDIVVVPV